MYTTFLIYRRSDFLQIPVGGVCLSGFVGLLQSDAGSKKDARMSDNGT